MVSHVSRSRAAPAVRSCGSYHYGHDVHFIQARLSSESGPGERRTVADIDDDGTIRFVAGAPVWNHDPERLRTVLSVYGPQVRIGSHGVLRVPSERGAYCFSIATERDPCRSDNSDAPTREPIIEEGLSRVAGTPIGVTSTPGPPANGAVRPRAYRAQVGAGI
jgi:hypothetical protein